MWHLIIKAGASVCCLGPMPSRHACEAGARRLAGAFQVYCLELSTGLVTNGRFEILDPDDFVGELGMSISSTTNGEPFDFIDLSRIDLPTTIVLDPTTPADPISDDTSSS